MDSRQPSPLAAQILKLVGILMIVSFLLDYLIILFPPNFLNRAWQITATTQIVERGVIPLIALALLFTGFWIDTTLGISRESNKPLFSLKLWALVFSSVLGLMFLLIFPFHLNNVRLSRNDALEQIKQQAGQSDQVKIQVEQRKAQIKSQFAELAKDPKKLDETIEKLSQIIASGEVKGDQQVNLQNQLDLLKKAKQDPKEFDKSVDRQAEEFENQMQAKLRDEKQQAEEQAQIGSWKSGLQTGTSSLLLAIGYSVIGWTGLKSLMSPKIGRRQASIR